MGIFSKFIKWHNEGLIAKPEPIAKVEVCKAVKKPLIYPMYYPKSKRVYWRVSEMPKPFNSSDMELWEPAHKYANRLNTLISIKILNERMAKQKGK